MATPVSRWLFLEEVARELRTSVSTVRHWIAIGRLRAFRPGRHILIARADLDEMIQRSEWRAGRRALVVVPDDEFTIGKKGGA
jgi:excisionase family DNA binding protein